MEELQNEMGVKFKSFEHLSYRKNRSRNLRKALTSLNLKKRQYDRILTEISLNDDPSVLRSISRKIEALSICIHLLEKKEKQLNSCGLGLSCTQA
jgi:hypothetical protein